MKILALELSSARGSLAWRDNGAGIERDWPNDRQNSGAFFENLVDVRRKFGLPHKVIVGLGPGSYAGTRIAISAAIGLQAASSATLIGYPSICALEYNQGGYCVIGDARRNSFFFALIRAHKLVEGPELFTEAELRRKLDKFEAKMPIFASEKLPQFELVELRYPSAGVLARLAANVNREFAQPPLQPMYLREPHITKAKAIRGIGSLADQPDTG
jgi:tRNA threonylcarbamoyladenosine biosynthesis protein TsaB